MYTSHRALHCTIRHTTHRTLGLIAIIVASVALTACGKPTAAVRDKQAPIVTVEADRVFRGDIQQTYNTITTLDADREAQVVARSNGIVETLYVEEGESVVAGQKLAQLDVEELSLQLKQLDAVLARMKADLEREETLYKRQLSQKSALDKARFDYQAQQAQRDLAALNLRYATIEAPFDGIVVERMVKLGNSVRNGDVLFSVVDPSSLKAVLFLPQKELAQVQLGQPVYLAVDAFPSLDIRGVVSRIRPKIDPDTGTFQVTASVENRDNTLRAGMFGRVELVFAVHPSTLLVTEDAIISQDNRHHVFVVEEGKAVQRDVTISIRHKGIVEIVAGLNEGDVVITGGKDIVKDGTLVEVI